SFGGVLGGAFAGLAAPYIFPTILEYPILLILALAILIRPARIGPAQTRHSVRLRAIGAAVALYAYNTGVSLPLDYDVEFRRVILLACCVVLLMFFMWRPAAVAVLALMLLVGGVVAPSSSLVYMTRSFFGVHKINDFRSGVFR